MFPTIISSSLFFFFFLLSHSSDFIFPPSFTLPTFNPLTSSLFMLFAAVTSGTVFFPVTVHFPCLYTLVYVCLCSTFSAFFFFICVCVCMHELHAALVW